MLDNNIKTQLRTYLEKLQQPIELIASLDGSGKAQEMLAMLQDIAALSAKGGKVDRLMIDATHLKAHTASPPTSLNLGCSRCTWRTKDG